MNDKIIEFTVGVNTYKLQLRTKQCILLEKKLGQSPLDLLMRLEDGKLPQLNDMITIITVGMMVHQPTMNENKVADLLDNYDHKRIVKPNGTVNDKKISYEECIEIINKLKFSNESNLFARERNEGLLFRTTSFHRVGFF